MPADIADREYAIARVRAQRFVLDAVGNAARWSWSGYRTSATAAVVEVRLDGQDWFKVERVIVVMDCGVDINPDVVTAQVEGSVGLAFSNALYSEITLQGGRVEKTNLDNYVSSESTRCPRSRCRRESGEDAIPVTTGALVNAIYAAGGPRLRSLPLRRSRLIRTRS